MRELILKMAMSLDGFVSDPDGRNHWMFGGDPEAKAWSVDFLWNAGLHIMGSRSFLDMAAWWPTATDQFAPPMNEIPKAVFSRQGPSILDSVSIADRPDAESGPSARPHASAGNWPTAAVASGDLREEIAKLKAQDGKPIIAHGGIRFARNLVAQRLVDRFALLVHPVALGRGLPLFSELAAPMRLELVTSTAFPGGAVAQVYRLS